MRVLNELNEILEEELKKIAKKGDITPTELESTYKAVDIMKDIETICAMRKADEESEMGYSRNRGYSYENSMGMPYYHAYNSMDGSYDGSYEGGSNRGMSNARGGRDGDGDGRYSENYSERRGRDAMGRYTSRDGGSYARGDYSRTDKREMMDKLQKMMNETNDPNVRKSIMQMMNEMG